MKKRVPIDFAGARLDRQLARTGLRLTAQRRQVYNVLLLKRDHPSAEEVFLRAKSAMPDISMATVYNCLDTLVKCGLVKQAGRHRAFVLFEHAAPPSLPLRWLRRRVRRKTPAGGRRAPFGPAPGLSRSDFRDFVSWPLPRVRRQREIRGGCDGSQRARDHMPTPSAPSSPMSTALDTIEQFVNTEYKYGFVSDIDTESLPPGLNEDVVRAISAKKQRAGLHARVAAESLPALADDEGAALGKRVLPPSITRPSVITRRPSPKPQPKSLDEVDPELLKTYQKLGIPLREQKRLAGVAVDAVFDSVSVATTFRETWPNWASSSVPSPRRCGNIRTWSGAPGFGGAVPGQLFCRAEFRGVQRRLLLLHPRGRALPDGAVHLFSDQCGQHGAI